MTKSIFLTAFIIIALVSCTQIERDYMEIPRTRVSIRPPVGYFKSNNFSGLETVKGRIITVNESNENYYEIIDDYKQNLIEYSGFRDFIFSDTIVDNYEATFVINNSTAETINSYSIIYGDSTFTVSIKALFKPNDQDIKEKLRKSLMSAKYSKNKTINPFEKVRFEIDTTLTQFKFIEYSNSIFWYGFDQTDKLKLPLVSITTNGMGFGNSLEQYSLISFKGFESTGLMGLLNDTVISGEINGCKSLITIADGFYETKKTYIYQLMLSKNKHSVDLTGMCYYDDEESKEVIQKFAETFRITK